MGKFHINGKGKVEPCKATIKTCPLGGLHVEANSQQEATQKVFDEMKKENPILASSKRQTNRTGTAPNREKKRTQPQEAVVCFKCGYKGPAANSCPKCGYSYSPGDESKLDKLSNALQQAYDKTYPKELTAIERVEQNVFSKQEEIANENLAQATIKRYRKKYGLENVSISYTGLPTNPTNLAVLTSTFAQMSDGIWENSKAIEKYWQHSNIIVSDGDIQIITAETYSSPFRNKSPKEVKEYYANKVKQVIKREWEDNAKDDKYKWDRNNTQELSYMHDFTYDGDKFTQDGKKNYVTRPITVADAYRVYDKLKGRKEK